MLQVRDRGRPRPGRRLARVYYWLSAGSALVGAALFTYAAFRGSGHLSFAFGGVWILNAVMWFSTARERSRREQRGYGQALPVPGPEVLNLMEQGKKIQAIKCYRRLNPGIGLKEAKDLIDGL